MLITELRQALGSESGVVTVSAERLNVPEIRAFLDAYYNGGAIVISGAGARPGEGGDAVVIQGQAPFLEVPDLPVVPRFALDARGTVTATLDYTVTPADPGPDPWRF